MGFVDLLARALERRATDRRLTERRQDTKGIDFPERRTGERRGPNQRRSDCK